MNLMIIEDHPKESLSKIFTTWAEGFPGLLVHHVIVLPTEKYNAHFSYTMFVFYDYKIPEQEFKKLKEDAELWRGTSK